MLDPTKPVRTRDGRKARIVCTDVPGLYSIVAVIFGNVGNETHVYAYVYDRGGFFLNASTPHEADLVNVDTPMTDDAGYINVYYSNTSDNLYAGIVHKSRRDADSVADEWDDRVACLRVKPGHFDD